MDHTQEAVVHIQGRSVGSRDHAHPYQAPCGVEEGDHNSHHYTHDILLEGHHNQVGGLQEGLAVSGVCWDWHWDLKWKSKSCLKVGVKASLSNGIKHVPYMGYRVIGNKAVAAMQQ